MKGKFVKEESTSDKKLKQEVRKYEKQYCAPSTGANRLFVHDPIKGLRFFYVQPQGGVN